VKQKNDMKKIITTASIAALGVVSLQAAYAPGLSSQERAKPWSVSASLRGFYDDNYATRPDMLDPVSGKKLKKNSFGIDLSPKFGLNFPMEQSLLQFDYTYDMRYYENRAHLKESSADHSHQINAKFGHEFTPGYRMDLSESFVVAQEADLLDPTFNTLKYRANGNNIHNNASAKFSGEFTPNFGITGGYANNLFDYDDPRYSALLDRMEHTMNVDFRYRALPQTWAVLGYQYQITDHTSKDSFDPLTGAYKKGTLTDPSIRDNTSHFVYVGADQMFTQKLNGSVRIGVQYTEFGNAEWLGGGMKSDATNPYADASASYVYMHNSTVQLGIRHARQQTDAFSMDSEATTLYTSISHEITAKLRASLLGQYQNSAFSGAFNATYKDQTEDYFSAGLNLEYTINQYLAAETGYNFDRLSSDLASRSFTRNRVYIGLRASY
jgi:hypothetical protein